MGKAADLKMLLADGIEQIGIDVPDQSRRAMLGYLSLLKRWNRVFNLSTVKSDVDFVKRHLLDSLSIVPYLQGSRMIDVGSGAGLPGVPIALACPDREVFLLDSNAKRCRFLLQVQAQLKLGNVTVIQQRAEAYKPENKFDSVVSRAFSNLALFISSSGDLVTDEGRLLAMKGQWPESTDKPQEKDEFAASFAVDDVIKLTVPGLLEQRHLVICKKII